MQIVALIRDGHGRLSVSATRAPDLLRRQISANTGAAELLWCGVPPMGQGAKAIVASINDRFGGDGDGALAAPVARIVKALVLATRTPVRHGLPWRRYLHRIGRMVTMILSQNATG